MVMEQAQVQIISVGLVMYYLNGNSTINKFLKIIYIIAWEQRVISEILDLQKMKSKIYAAFTNFNSKPQQIEDTVTSLKQRPVP